MPELIGLSVFFLLFGWFQSRNAHGLRKFINLGIAVGVGVALYLFGRELLVQSGSLDSFYIGHAVAAAVLSGVFSASFYALGAWLRRDAKSAKF